MSCDYDQIDPDVFADAFNACRSYAGMGAIIVRFDPYAEESWIVDINYSDNSRYIGQSEHINVALREAARKVRENPPRI